MTPLKRGDKPQILGSRVVIEHLTELKRKHRSGQAISGDDIGMWYRDEEVVIALTEVQQERCAYCEGPLYPLTGEKGQVEHYRPKSDWCNEPGEPRGQGGYFWLAYEWENLLLACGRCNNKKRTLFPLNDKSKRATSPKHDLGREEPRLLNPYDPADWEVTHFVYDGHSIKPWQGCQRAEATIDTLWLNGKPTKIKDASPKDIQEAAGFLLARRKALENADRAVRNAERTCARLAETELDEIKDILDGLLAPITGPQNYFLGMLMFHHGSKIETLRQKLEAKTRKVVAAPKSKHAGQGKRQSSSTGTLKRKKQSKGRG